MAKSQINKRSGDQVKNFINLDFEIIQNNLCCSCGACVAYCESQNFNVIEMVNYTPKFKSEKHEKNCTECGVCYYICPETDTLADLLPTSTPMEENLIPLIDKIAAKYSDKEIPEVDEEWSVVTIILWYLFDKHKIDAAVVSEYDDHLKSRPKLIFDKKELLENAETRFSIRKQILPLKDLYNIPLEIQKEKVFYDLDQMRVALVGTPCQIRAIRKMKLLSIKPAHVIKYMIPSIIERFKGNHEDVWNQVKTLL